jgi:hypothetical protein
MTMGIGRRRFNPFNGMENWKLNSITSPKIELDKRNFQKTSLI